MDIQEINEKIADDLQWEWEEKPNINIIPRGKYEVVDYDDSRWEEVEREKCRWCGINLSESGTHPGLCVELCSVCGDKLVGGKCPTHQILGDSPPKTFSHVCICPVCHGRGLVMSGFYQGGGTTFYGDGTQEKCRSCENGVIRV